MAHNIFAKSPVQLATEKADARTRSIFDGMQQPQGGAAPAPSGPVATDFDTLARTYQVPMNIIEAASEAAGIEDAGKAGQFASGFAEAMGSQIAGGKSVEDAMRATFPKGVDTDAILQRAVALVGGPGQTGQSDAGEDGEYDPEGTVIGRAWDRGVLRTKSTLPALAAQKDSAVLADAQLSDGDIIRSAFLETTRLPEVPDGVDLSTPEKAAAAITGLGYPDEWANIFRGSLDIRSRDAAAAKGNEAEILDRAAGNLLESKRLNEEAAAIPSGEWASSFKKVFEAAPDTVLGTLKAYATNPITAAAFLGETAVESAPQMVASGLTTLITRSSALGAIVLGSGVVSQEFGPSVAEFFEEQRIAPKNANEAADLIRNPTFMAEAARRGLGRGVVIALAEMTGQGFAAQKIFKTATKEAIKNVGAQAVTGGGGEALARAATGQAMSAKEIITEALAEGVAAPAEVGPVVFNEWRNSRGAKPAPDPEPATDAAPDAPLALPAPEPATDAAPDAPLALPAPEPAPDAAPEPSGPLGRAAGLAPDMPPAPAPMATSSMVEGSKVRLEVPGGVPVDAVFKGETEEGMTFEQDGNPFFITREEIEAGKVAVVPVNPIIEAQAPQMPEVPEQSPFDGQTRFDVATEVDHGIAFALGDKGDGIYRGLDVRDVPIQTAMKAGAKAALDGAETPPIYPVPEINSAAQAGFELARNRAQTRLSIEPTGQPQGVVAPSPMPQPKAPGKPILQKRPFTNIIKAASGGIDPAGPLGLELIHRGVNPQTTPGLFRTSGAQNLDNLPASEYGEFAGIIGEDGNGYLSEQGIIDALAEEVAGTPVQGRDQAELQAEADAKAELAEMRDLGVEIDGAGQVGVAPDEAASVRIIPQRSELDDFDSVGADRQEAIWRDIRSVERDIGSDLAARDRQAIFDNLNDNGGIVEDAVWWQLEREPEEDESRQTVQDSGPPLFESELSGESGREGTGAISESDGRPEGDPGEEGLRPTPTGPSDGAGSPAPAPEVATKPDLQDEWWRSLIRARHSAKQVGLSKADLGDTWGDKGRLVAAVDSALSEKGFTDLMAPSPEPQNEPQNIHEIIPEPATEQTPEGEQTLIPGVTPVTDLDRAEAQAAKPKRGGDAPMQTGGLFDVGARDQTDMFSDAAQEPSSATKSAGNEPQTPLSAVDAPQAQDDWWKTRPKARHAAKQVGFDRQSVGDDAWNDLPRLVATVNDRLRVMGFDDLLAPEPEAATDEPGFAPLRAGYERTMVGGNPSTTQTRMTNDGFVVNRTPERTQIIDPKGRVIRDGAHDMPESEVEATIDDLRKPEVMARIEGKAQAKPIRGPRKITQAQWDAKPAEYKGIREDGTHVWNELDKESGATISRPVEIEGNPPTELKDTVLVDVDGEPLVLHHYTHTDFDFKDYDLQYAAKKFGRDMEGIDTVGIWFTTDESFSYGPKRMSAQIAMSNPLRIDGKGDGFTAFNTLDAMRKDAGGSTNLRKNLKQDGYDGVLFSNTKLDGIEQNIVIAFDADQVQQTAKQDRPAKVDVDAAAAEADPNPSEAQAKAGNYKKGHIAWNGLDLAIETAKGEERTGTDSDGETWSVTMPAHYGDFKRTEGADGDPVDFYMGDMPGSDHVVIVNQIDPDTGKFDEHKIVLGTGGTAAALKIYEGGFSDGSGKARNGSHTATTVDGLKAWLKDGDNTKPTEPITAKDQNPIKNETPAKPEYGAKNTLVSQDRAKELRERLKAKLRDQLNAGIDPEVMAIGAELAVFHIEAGARKFVDLAKTIADDLGTTPDKLRPYLRSWYNGARDMMEDSGLSIDGMDDAEAVRAAIKGGALEAAPEPAPEQSTSPAQGDMFGDNQPKDLFDDNRDNASDGQRSEGEGTASERQGQTGKLRSESGDSGRQGSGTPEHTAGRHERPADGARGSDGRSDAGSPERPRARNHVITAGGLEPTRGEKTRARESIAAIRVLRELEATSQPATDEQRATLAKYGGAGTLANALPRADGSIRHADLAAELDELLTDEEKETLSRTSQYAFYTAESALRSMWRLAERLGFRGGRVYEPGMGVGGFAGTIPDGIRDTTSYEGLELDHITAAIAGKLYPNHKIRQGDFIKSMLPQGYYDMVIGNPPFAGTRIEADKDYPQRFMLHDYFFAKSLDAVRPGGLLMFITSAGTMNKLDSKARDYLADRADLVGAIRLPNTAFKENGTEVTTDIIVLRKRLEGEAEAGPAWRASDSVELLDKDGVAGFAAVNDYFTSNPDMILGEQGLFDTLTAAPRVGVRPRPGSDLATDLQKVVNEKFPENIMSQAADDVKLDALDTDSAEKKTGSYYMRDGVLHQFDGRVGNPVQARGKGVKGGKTKTQIAMIRQLVPVKDALRDVYAADVAGEDATQARKELNRVYDAFTARNGPVGKQERTYRRPSAVEMEGLRQQALQDARAAGKDFDVGSFDPSSMLDRPALVSISKAVETGKKATWIVDGNLMIDGKPWRPAPLREVAAARKRAMADADYREGDFDPDSVDDKVLVKRPNVDAFMDDPESYRLLAVEKYDEKTDTAEKSLVFTENAVSRSVTPELNSPEDALLYLLADTGRIDLDQIAQKLGSDPQTVRRELGDKIFKNPDTGQFETRSKYLSGNVRKKLDEARNSAMSNPEYKVNETELEAVQPEPVTAEEIRVPIGAHWFDAGVYSDFAKSLGMTLKVDFKRGLGLWEVIGGDTTSAAAKNEWGTNDKPFADLMALLLNNKKVEVAHKDKDGNRLVDEVSTQEAKDKGNELQEKFSEWFWEDENRAAEMEDLYNKTFNAEVAPAYEVVKPLRSTSISSPAPPRKARSNNWPLWPSWRSRKMLCSSGRPVWVKPTSQ